jgi:hypothetical protein
MSNRVFVTAFYTHFHEFLDQMVRLFPDDTDLPTYKTALTLLQKSNPMLVPKEVVNHVSPFETSIRARDEKFFLDYSFTEYQDGAIDQVIGKVKALWSTLTDSNKKAIWDYITILLDLAYRCSAGKSTA